ncbi:hypothetical protein OG453_31730 [Streptomyces sp. NBC_01381]|uniref:hypothetical protein n=1 Tax=Streptomyces sp. NBC_01381 TaxID=2903845 RepID=UPI00224E394D|nr:hypothetical protein [Streptomyces sp. NBC_01381]MCX4671199.1 hypothetical protein [Streptomyces sp. NBC_01381]
MQASVTLLVDLAEHGTNNLVLADCCPVRSELLPVYCEQLLTDARSAQEFEDAVLASAQPWHQLDQQL